MARFPLQVRSTTFRMAAAVAALAVTVPVVGAHGVAKPRPVRMLSCGRASLLKGAAAEWQEVAAPTFLPPNGLGSVSQKVVSHAVDPANDSHLAVTNGNSVWVSSNGGCTWEQGVRLDRVPADPQRIPLSSDLTTIKFVSIGRNGTVYALAEEVETGATVGRPHVLLSSQRGTAGTWTLGDQGLPPIGHPVTLRAAVNSDVMYLSFSEVREEQAGGTPCPPAPLPCPTGGGGNDEPPGLLWASADGGRSWSQRLDAADLNTSRIRYLSIEDDDRTGNTLWAVVNGTLRRSTDGGRSFPIPPGVPQDGFTFTAVESINQGYVPTPIKLVAFGDGGRMLRLTNTGKWIPSQVQFSNVESVTQRREGDIIVATSPKTGGVVVWRIFGNDFRDFEQKVGLGGITFRQTYGWESISPNRPIQVDAGLSEGESNAGDAGTFYIKDERSVLRFLRSTKRGRLPIRSGPLGAPPPPRGKILPSLLDVDIPVNGTRTVDYKLTLPPAPTPIDVFLLIDNSGSMEPLIEDLRYNLVDVAKNLHDSGVDVHMGIGVINVQPEKFAPPVDDPRTPDRDESKPKPLYEVLRKIGPIDGGLFTALEQIDGHGGAGDEAQVEALYQSVTGEGLDLEGVGWLLGYTVRPGQVAGYRTDTDSIKVVVHATDEAFSTNIVNGHTVAEAAKVLKNAGVRQIGLSQGVADAHRDLQDMARRTGALAPRAGVDCDGDGHKDIQQGGPLVCGTSFGLDTTLINLIKSFRDPATISLRGSRSETLRSVSRGSFAINAKAPTSVRFKATFSCVGLAAGSYLNDFTASLRDVEIAKAVATVNCGGVSTPPRPPLQPGGLTEPAQPQPPPQPQPLPPGVAPINPIAQPQSQIQVQSQVQPQAGAAHEEQEQLEVATAANDLRPGDEQELAMTGLDHDGPSPGMVNAAGMVLASACATGVGLRRRTRTRLARAQIRR
jgi:hypothetical protein